MPFQQMTCTRGSSTQRCAFEQVQRGPFKPLRKRELKGHAALVTDTPGGALHEGKGQGQNVDPKTRSDHEPFLRLTITPQHPMHLPALIGCRLPLSPNGRAWRR
jgi:hypothetical protein